ncbi:LolA family protein [Poseidonocella sedimentorum]|uniref:Outer membrane lipoprotein-sorting protein n=1 Tax=Poseidonocella sedimentorum TaxID=871652 RepID=A0A1I6DVN6_9RHOB|nr:outer-membrane lipoprotein carrier protein LolA [Poseidonocella sedimentorum]SFR09570.1 Outer membrane lipoprotein-sorting protein [Poseidonocella sedimentorum]
MSQQSSDGHVSEGIFYLSRPGRLRFEYFDPVPITLFAEGTRAGIVNRTKQTMTVIPVGQVPLHILLRDPVDLGRDGMVRSVEVEGGLARVRMVDPGRPDAGAITMVFSTGPVELRDWIITDDHGRSSRISLRNLRRGVVIDPRQFIGARN